MNIKIFKMNCITNLHTGSGEANFNIIDNEVEKDPVTNYPVIHSSGIKGALKDAAKGANYIDRVFGKPESKDDKGSGGLYNFMSAHLLARPLRVNGDSRRAYIAVTTLQAINDFIEFAVNFGINIGRQDKIDIAFGSSSFLSTVVGIKIEGKPVGTFAAGDAAAVDFIKGLIGDFALCKDFDDYPLPVNPRNSLDENGISKNLWYEEFVPHHSVFWMPVRYPDETFALNFLTDEVVQLGGNASIGNGFVKFEEI